LSGAGRDACAQPYAKRWAGLSDDSRYRDPAGPVGFFSDGHGIAAFTQWFDDVTNLNQIEWDMVQADYWADTIVDMDRQRRKQAEFLVCRIAEHRLY